MNSSHTPRSSGFTHTLPLDPTNSEHGLLNLRQKTGPIDIPEAMLTAPFLQYSALTPGQKRYLHSVCEAYSEAHMQKLMQQHYLNVLHRSISIGNFMPNSIKPLRRSLPDLNHTSTEQKESSDQKVKDQKDRSASKKMTILPKINNQQQRASESLLRKFQPRRKRKNKT